jgi:FkbM family methyltransferase
MINYADKALHYLGKTGANVFSICIGAMDGVMFDDFSGYISMYKFPTLYVEPMPEMFRRLRTNITDPIHRFENAAISTYNGEIEMLTIDTEAIDRNEVHQCFYGMSSIYPPKNGLASDGDRATVEKFGKRVNVTCMTLDTLINKHYINQIDIFKTDTEGHDYPIFKQLDFNRYRPKLIHMEWINMNTEEQQAVKNKLDAEGYVYEISGQDISAVPSEFAKTIIEYFEEATPVAPEPQPEPIPTPAAQIPNISNVTIVTGLWDLGRGNLEGFGRTFQNYLDRFEELLKSDINMYIHVPAELEAWVWERRQAHNTRVRIMERDGFREWFAFYNETTAIRQQPEWYNYAGWLPNSPQAKLEFYNPVVMSKMFMLNDATIFNPFNTDYFFWVDGGLTNTVHQGYFNHDGVFNNLSYYYEINNKFLFLSYPYEGNDEIHGFKREGMNRYCAVDYVRYVCRGGFFGGRKDHINQINNIYYNYLQNSLREGYMGTEESIFTIIAHRHEDIVHRFEIGGDGLVWPFFEQLKTIRETVKMIPKGNKPLSEVKVSVYVIGFNIPSQFEHLCKSFETADKDFLAKPRKILLNNSTDRNTDAEYARICQQYGFEEIKKDNLGICGGRQFIAEHFAESDSDYYFFFEDDMLLQQPNVGGVDKYGFKTYVEGLYDRTVKVMHETQYDYIKLSFTELYGDNSSQWAWYNIPQHIREEFFPEKTKLPVHGLDPNTPKTKFNNIRNLHGITLVDGEIYYCNWPQIVNKQGNNKVFLETTWARPYEQTWMSYVFQEQKKGNIKAAIFMMSPINHDRIIYYEGTQRKES